MKSNRDLLVGLFLFLLINSAAMAQVPGLPNASSAQTIVQDVGLGQVKVTYSRPNVKGRKVFGALVPYNEVWRTGANTATILSLPQDVSFEGQKVPAGDYSLFTIPGKEEWTIIINKASKEWGAYSYDAQKDLVRFKVKAAQIATPVETFTISFANAGAESTDLQLTWEHTTVSVHLLADDDARITANIEQLMQADHNENLVYFNCIQYFINHNKDADKALGWVVKAKADVPTNPAYDLFKSRLLLRKGDKPGAIAAAQAGIKLATERKFDEYIRLNEQALAEARK
ncbi:Protein of unknown function [Dyadobacter soli]|uniref:DUF2911 domain-containing protein n=1 Tax=Dyadobacter soli TaxID=659014 RepID=A0A1G6VQY4_9BACT|nr:DUF2911 domain-containing protein [Dyadobacter soli]SDD56032.1 Protein of unknown function [Dyadobacter soli]